MQLTPRQRQVFRFIWQFIKTHGYSPTLEEIGRGIGVSSLHSVQKHLEMLSRKGMIRRHANLGRSIELLVGVPYPCTIELPLLGIISAGEPIEAVENPELISVPAELVRGRETFVLRVRGNSMIEEQIRDGDYIVVERRSRADNGEIVVALVGGQEATIKKFYRDNDMVRLEAANTHQPPLILPPEAVEIKGVVVALLRKYK